MRRAVRGTPRVLLFQGRALVGSNFSSSIFGVLNPSPVSRSLRHTMSSSSTTTTSSCTPGQPPQPPQPPLVFTPTCDLYDQHVDRARVPCLAWQSYGRKKQFCGRAYTIKCHEDNSRLKEATELPGHHRVLVVDAGGSTRCAVMGDMLAANAVKNQWAGVIVHGCVRDVDALGQMDGLGVMALGTTPRKSTRRGEGQVNLPVQLGPDVWVNPGDWVFADRDGVLILDPQETE